MSNGNTWEDLIPHTIKAGITLQTKGSYVKEEHEATIYLPANSPINYVQYRKLQEAALLRKLIWEGLFHFGGNITYEEYRKGIDETNQSLQMAEDKFNFKPQVLVLLDRETTELIIVKLFSDIIVLNSYLIKQYGFTVEDVSRGALSERFRGTVIRQEEWYHSKEMQMTGSILPEGAIISREVLEEDTLT